MTMGAVDAVSAPSGRVCESLLEAIGQVAEQLVGMELDDDAFRGMLHLIGRAADVSRVRVYRMDPADRTRRPATLALEWCDDDVAPCNRGSEVPFAVFGGAFARWEHALAERQALAARRSELPNEAARLMVAQQTLSFALVPIHTQGGFWGFLAFDDCRTERVWSPEVLRALRIFCRILASALDRRADRRLHATLKASHEALLQNLNEGVFMTDARGRFTYLNGAWQALTGYSPQEALGKFCGMLVTAEEGRSCRAALLGLLSGELITQRCDVKLRCADGSSRWVQISARHIAVGPQERCGLVGTVIDISKSKQAEQELLAAKQEAEAASRAKSEFLSTMSHELRTPLNAVIGLSEALLASEGEVDPTRSRRYLQLIHQAGRQLHLEINDMLDLARIEAGRLRLAPTLTDVRTLAATAVEGARAEAEAKSIQLELVRPADPILLWVDQRLISQALSNLLRNAVKFTPDGGRVAVSVASNSDGDALLCVEDSGIGIPPDKLHLLFKPFSQLDSSLSRRFSGVGLGLVLVDKFARLHGGSVSVRSQPQCGSAFTLRLPVRPPQEEGAAPGPASQSL